MPELDIPLPEPEGKLDLRECQQMSALTSTAASRTHPIRRMGDEKKIRRMGEEESEALR